ncbi:hypothetical protein CLOM_g10893 [Closterium sp. NIES-68]|nr:hypothetical protein CLOM_g10893 [Closterium sp. NIES-68]
MAPTASSVHSSSLHLAAAGAVLVVVAGTGLYCLVYSPYRFIRQCKKQGIPFLPFRPLIGQIPEIKSSGDPKATIIPVLDESETPAEDSGTRDDHGASAAAGMESEAAPSVAYGPRMHSPLLCEWISKHGTVVGFSIGPSPTVLIAEPSLVKQVLITKAASFSKTEASRQILGFLGNGLPLSEGKFWARQRRMLNPAFAPLCIQRMAVTMDQQARLAAQRWSQAVARAKDHESNRAEGRARGHEVGVQEEQHAHAATRHASGRAGGWARGHEVDVQEALSAVTLDIIGLTAFGEAVGDEGVEGGGMVGVRGRDEREEGDGLVDTDVLDSQAGGVDSRAGGVKSRAGGVDSRAGGVESRAGGVDSRAVYMAVSELSERCMQRVFSGRAFIPLYTWLPTQENRAIAAASERIKALALSLVARRRLALKEGREGHNLLDAMLAARDDETNEQMTDQQLVDECITFLFAGHETTAKLLMWTMFLLARHPTWQQRLRREVWRVVGRGGAQGERQVGEGEEGTRKKGGEGTEGEGRGEEVGGGGRLCVRWEHVGALEEMGMVLHESVRLFPPVPSLMRQSTKPVEVGPYSFPPNTQLVLAVGFMQGDPRWWGEDAHCFNPERFRNGVDGACSDPLAFLPFAVGPRKCIGYAFAFAEAKIILCHLLNSLQWRVSPSYVHEPSLGITLYAKQGMPLLFDPVDN